MEKELQIFVMRWPVELYREVWETARRQDRSMASLMREAARLYVATSRRLEGDMPEALP